MKKIYISGPMRGYPEDNYPTFDAMEATLKQSPQPPIAIYNPAKEGRKIRNWLGIEPEEETELLLQEVFKADTNWICTKATHLVMLPGWSESKGALAEYHLARALGLTITGATH